MKQRLFFYLIFTLISSYCWSQINSNLQMPLSVNGDGAAPDASALLDLKANDKGILIPRLTTAERSTLSATAATSLLVYDSDLATFFFYDSAAWIPLVSGSNNDADADPANELIQSTQLNGADLEIMDAGATHTVDLSSLGSEWDTSNVDIHNTNAGNVGIGTSSPTAKLEVQGGNIALNDDFALKFLRNDGTTAGQIVGEFEGMTLKESRGAHTTKMQLGGSDIDFVTDDSTQMKILADGKVAIGLTSPDSKLHVHNGTAGSIVANSKAIATFENNTDGYLNLLTPNDEESGVLFGTPFLGSAGGGLVFNNSLTPNGLQFRTDGNSIKMVIVEIGNVGIGTTTPTYKLEVEANIPNNGVAKIHNASEAGFAGTYFYSNNVNKGYIGYVGNGSWVQPNSFQIGVFGGTDIKFLTSSGPPRMTISGSNGNVGFNQIYPNVGLNMRNPSVSTIPFLISKIQMGFPGFM